MLNSIETISLQRAAIELRKSAIHGYGVFCQQAIALDGVIEECPVLLINEPSKDLENYWFYWDKPDTMAMPLGYGCIYNSAKNPNATAIQDYERKILVIRALKTIKAGEEILISYGKEWFKERAITEIKPISETKDTVLFIGKVLIVVTVAILITWLTK